MKGDSLLWCHNDVISYRNSHILFICWEQIYKSVYFLRANKLFQPIDAILTQNKLQISQLFEVNKQIMYLKGGGCLSTKGPSGPEVDKFPDHPERT